jgi:type IV secretory pathway TraG/TraD family ATPase VirD4
MPTELPVEPGVIDLPPSAVAVCINKSLQICGWKVVGGSIEHEFLTAKLEEKRPVLGTVWNWCFQVTFEWEVYGKDQTFLSIRIVENNYSSSIQPLMEKQQILFKQIEKEFEKRKRKGPPQPDPNIFDVSKFATTEELDRAGLLSKYSGQNLFDGYLPVRRLLICQNDAGILSLPPQFTERHVFLCGSTGAGKSSGLFIPNILATTSSSAIITEVMVGEGETSLYQQTAGWRAKKRHAIHYFNPLDKTSCRINPLDMVHSDADARHVTNLIMKSTSTPGAGRSEQFWETSERILLTALILHAVGERERGDCNFSYICRLLEEDDDYLQSIVGDSEIEAAARRFKSFMSRGSKDTRNITIAMVSQRLDLFRNDLIAQLTNTTDFSPESLANELFTLYIAVPADTEFVQPVAILIWNYALKLIMETKFTKPLMLFLDEFANFGYIKGMQQKLTLIRHKKIGAMLGVQFLQQLQLTYHDEASVFYTQPATKIYFKPFDFHEAERLCKALGKTTKVQEIFSTTGVSVRYHERDLMSVPKLTSMKQGEMLVFWPDSNPTLERAFTHQSTAQFTSLPPPTRKPIEADLSLKRRIKKAPSEMDADRALRSLSKAKRLEDKLVEQNFAKEERERERAVEITTQQAIDNFGTATDYINYDAPDQQMF